MTLLDQILQHPDVVKPPNSRTGEALAWCPWHNDKDGKKPNLGINVQKRTVKCFRCGEPERQPLRSLAEKWGIITPKTPQGEITATYDYRDEAAGLLFQVVRLVDPDGSKRFLQRRPHSRRPGDWVWKLGNTRRVPYRLPEILEVTAGEHWVFVTEGEKDADLLASLGLVATTNSGGAGKWRSEYNEYFRGHKVAVLPDNDEPGADHALQVARSLLPFVAEVRIVELDGLPPRGDVTDWLNDGHQMPDLVETVEEASALRPAEGITPPPSNNGHGPDSSAAFWEPPKWRGISAEIIRRLSTHGYLIQAEGLYYFFDQETKKLCEIEHDSLDLDVLLRERYAVNGTDRLYSYLLRELTVEAVVRGQSAIVRQFAYYDEVHNVAYLNMNDGSVLKLDGQDIQVRDNGSDGVLFAPVPFAEPWQYVPEPGLTIAETLIEPMNFIEEESTPFTPDEQRMLMLIWTLSIAFESLQPTKPLALAVGPAGSGKSSLFRRIGQLLFGSRYQVDALRKDKEDDYWVTVTNRPFATFDNVDGYFPWLNDALAQTSTGIQVPKRKLHTTNTMVAFSPRCMLSLTARTPSFRREDIASRLLVFHLDRLPEKRPEFELLQEIQANRDALMSDYARMINKVLPANGAIEVDPNIRLADFARVAARIGEGLDAGELTTQILGKVRRSQFIYATEENPLFLLIDSWLPMAPKDTSQLAFEGTTNNGRKVPGSQLFKELTELAESSGIRWPFRNAISMGMAINNMSEELGLHFEMDDGRDGRKRWYRFKHRQE